MRKKFAEAMRDLYDPRIFESKEQFGKNWVFHRIKVSVDNGEEMSLEFLKELYSAYDDFVEEEMPFLYI